MTARALLATVVLVAFATGCRSLVDPDTELRRPQARGMDGRVIVTTSIPVGLTQVTVSNTVYAPSGEGFAQSAPLTSSGYFSVEIPAGVRGYFDVAVEFSTPFGLRSYLFIGVERTDSILQLELELVPVWGVLTVPAELQPFAFASSDLLLRRTERRPADGAPYLRVWYPRVSADGVIEDLAPRGPWEAKVRTGPRGPFASLETVVDPAFVAGELDVVLPWKRLDVELRVPENWSEITSFTLEMQSYERDFVRQETPLRGGAADVWVTGRWVRARPAWPDWLHPAYAVVLPASWGGWTDVASLDRIALLLPPRILTVRVRDADVPVQGALVAVHRPREVHTLRTREDGSCFHLGENGHLVLKITHGDREITRSVMVDGDTEIVVDLAESRRNARD
jgi:hypothetical protein